MIYFNGLWFWMPTLMGFVAFTLAVMLCIRINNLELPRLWRWTAFLWALIVLATSLFDLNQTCCYQSVDSARWAVFSRSMIRAGHIFIILVVYRGLARTFPRRMIRSIYEPTPSCRIAQ